MYTIEVDFEVYRELFVRRKSEAISVNDVLREVLRIGGAVIPEDRAGRRVWTTKGVRFPHGTKIRGFHSGQWRFGEIVDGHLTVEGTSYTSLSAAARTIRGFSDDGWRFWEVQFPASEIWTRCADLRSAKSHAAA